MKREVRILLVGENGVGKTSLVLSLVSEEFPCKVPSKAEEITIPADVTPERMPTQIVDTCSQEQSEKVIFNEFEKADVICVVYSLVDLKSIEKITSYWLPSIRKTLTNRNLRTPVILVGNKSDLCHESRLEAVLPIMNQFYEVETCIECSARLMRNLSETFWFAQKAVLYPTAPLYRLEDKELTVQCRNALSRIFRICDLDNDGYLNDSELETFQRRCFKIPLHPQSLEDVKSVIRRSTHDGIMPQGLTLRGFLFLHQLFIQKGRHETTWAVLRKFGYDNDLKLSSEFLKPVLSVPPGCSTELTHNAQQFLAQLFNRHNVEKNGALSPSEMQSLFHSCPFNPWGSEVLNAVCTTPHGWITRKGFLAQWTLLAYMNVHKALEYLAYIGYTYEFDSLESAIQITREKRIDLHRRQTQRFVFRCKVLGSRKVGKTCFLQAHLGRKLQYIATLNRTQVPNFTCAAVTVHGQERHLILEEVDWAQAEQMRDNEALDCDVVALLYDITNPESFKYIADLYQNYYRGTRIPCLIVACKSEQIEVPQFYHLEPSEFCSKYRLPEPCHFSCLDNIIEEPFARLTSMANYPHIKGLQLAPTDYGWKLTLAASVLAGFGFVAFKLSKMHM